MATNKALREALLKKMSWTKQALSARVQKKKKAVPMSTEDAVYLIAHECGLKVDKYLGKEEVARVRGLHSQSAPVVVHTHRPTRKVITHREIRLSSDFKEEAPLLSASKIQEAKEMAAVFPFLHVLENSMRELIKRVMHKKYGEKWWDNELTSGKLKGVHQTAASRTATQDKKHFWHQRRGSHPIDYVDLGHLGDIISGKADDFFPSIIPQREFLESMMRELEPSRNVVCHMNPLEKGNVHDVKSWLRKWSNTIDAAEKRGTIPPAAPELKE
jgi:hypothetical protein